MKKEWILTRILKVLFICGGICVGLFLITSQSNGQFSYNPYGGGYQQPYYPYSNYFGFSPFGYQQTYNPYVYQQSYNFYGYQQPYNPYSYQQPYNPYGYGYQQSFYYPYGYGETFNPYGYQQAYPYSSLTYEQLWNTGLPAFLSGMDPRMAIAYVGSNGLGLDPYTKDYLIPGVWGGP